VWKEIRSGFFYLAPQMGKKGPVGEAQNLYPCKSIDRVGYLSAMLAKKTSEGR